MTTLIERLQQAERGSFELDLAMAEWAYSGNAPGLVSYDPGLWLQRNDGFTTSIDAAVALVGQVLPGWVWSITRYDGETAMAEIAPTVWPHYDNAADVGGATEEAHTPALAICIALLKAKEAQG